MHMTARTSLNQRKVIDAGTRTKSRLQYLQAKFAKGCGPVSLVFLRNRRTGQTQHSTTPGQHAPAAVDEAHASTGEFLRHNPMKETHR
jgi:hypothetical protein